MVEILSGVGSGESMMYVTVDEKDLIDRLFQLKSEAAIYYRQGRKIAYHWLLNTVTIGKLKIAPK